MREKPQSGFRKYVGPLAAAVGFLSTFLFFQFAYPYHLIKREQANLFVYDGDYIAETYRGMGWLARFIADFLEQFFHLPVAGPLIVALLVTGIGIVVYRILRHFLGLWPSLGIAALVFVWAFLRETGNIYTTRYTVVVLGYLSLILAALQFRKAWQKALAAVVFLAVGVWALGSPYHKYYGMLFNKPTVGYERMIGLDAEVARENWDKVLELSKKDLFTVEASFCYNLAHAMKGDLGSMMMSHSQGKAYDLLPPVSIDRTAFSDCLAGEAWYQLGNITVAEQGAIVALQSSPDHTGARYIKRLAEVNLISGEDAAAQKYLNLLYHTLFYRKWARSRMPGRQDATVRAALDAARANLPVSDFVHQSENPRNVLLSLLDANPSNTVARNYLLCYDMLRYDLDSFMADYSAYPAKGRLYNEAILIWLSQNGLMNEQEIARRGIDKSTVDRLGRFYQNPNAFRDSYWFYYLKALQAQQSQ